VSVTQALPLILSIVTIGGTAINIFVSLRLAALQAKLTAENAALEVALLKQFVGWKDEVLQAINGKYVSATLIAEIRSNLGRELAHIAARLEHLEQRCEDRRSECLEVLRSRPAE
jgi:hypothetical protein